MNRFLKFGTALFLFATLFVLPILISNAHAQDTAANLGRFQLNIQSRTLSHAGTNNASLAGFEISRFSKTGTFAWGVFGLFGLNEIRTEPDHLPETTGSLLSLPGVNESFSFTNIRSFGFSSRYRVLNQGRFSGWMTSALSVNLYQEKTTSLGLRQGSTIENILFDTVETTGTTGFWAIEPGFLMQFQIWGPLSMSVNGTAAFRTSSTDTEQFRRFNIGAGIGIRM